MADQHGTRAAAGAPRSSSAIPFEDRLRMVRVWTCIGGILIFIAVLVALGYLGPVIEFLGVGIIVGFICSPIVNSLERHGVGRALGALIALVVVLGVAIGIVALLGPPFTEQLLSLLEKIPGYLHEAQIWVQNLIEKYGTAETSDLQTNMTGIVEGLSTMGSRFATDLASQISTGILPNLMNIVNVFFMFFLGLVLAYWLARDYPRIVREFAIIAGPKHQDDLTLLLAVASRSMGGYMRGIVITSIVGGTLAFLGFLLVGQPYAPLMGILTGLLHFIPVIGPWISAAIATVTALFVSPICALWTLVVAMIAENVTDNLVSPVVMRSAVQVHPAMSLLAIVIGSTLGGAVGMAISIPVSAAIKGVFVYYFETKTGRQIVSYDGAIFQGTPFRHADGSPAPSFDALDDDHFFATSKLVPESAEPDVSAEKPPQPAKPPVAQTIRKHAEEAKAIVEGALKRDEDYVVESKEDVHDAETPEDTEAPAPEPRDADQPDSAPSEGDGPEDAHKQ